MQDLASFDLKPGNVAVIPTDTVYGLVCQALDQAAVEKLYSLKEREKKPGTIIAASVDQLVELGLKRRYIKPIEHLWPNPISVILPSEVNLSYLDQGQGTLAVRIVADKELAKLLERTGPLLTSSANLPGRPPANNIKEAKEYFGEHVDEYVDGGDLSDRQPSTVVRIIDDAVEILRDGSVKLNEKGEIET